MLRRKVDKTRGRFSQQHLMVQYKVVWSLLCRFYLSQISDYIHKYVNLRFGSTVCCRVDIDLVDYVTETCSPS